MTTRLIGQYCCPQCGFDTETLHEGYCQECCEQRQQELNLHNARFDWWDSLSDAERRDQIRRGL